MGFLYIYIYKKNPTNSKKDSRTQSILENKKKKKRADQLRTTGLSDVHFQFKIYLQANSCYTDRKWSSQCNKLKGCMKKSINYCLEINEKLMYASLTWEIVSFTPAYWRNCESVSNIYNFENNNNKKNDKNISERVWRRCQIITT